MAGEPAEAHTRPENRLSLTHISSAIMAGIGQRPIVNLEEGWTEIKVKALDVLEKMIETGVKNDNNYFNPAEYVATYTKCYDMCTQREPHSWSIQLYERHGESLRHYLRTVSLPAILSQPDSPPHVLLREYVTRWNNHKIMNKWYQRFFMYLDRYHIVHYNLPTLSDSGWTIFKEVVYNPTKVRLWLAKATDK